MKLAALFHGKIGIIAGSTALGLATVGAAAGVVVSEGRALPKADVTVATSAPTTSTTEPPTTTTTVAPDPEPAPDPAPAPQQNPGPQNPAPAPPPPPPPVSPAPGGITGGVFAAHNADRAANGLGQLGWNGNLAGIAQGWANWMAQNGSLTHQNLNAVIGGTGFMMMGENILVGPGSMSISDMETAWMNSPGHRANILKPEYTAAGVGAAVSADGRLWVAVEFGG